MAEYQLSVDGGSYTPVDNLTWNTSYRYDSSLRPDNATSTLSVTVNTFVSTDRDASCPTPPEQPQFSTPGDIGSYHTISLRKECDTSHTVIFTGKKAKVVSRSNNNSLEPSRARFSQSITEYEIYEENYLFPAANRQEEPLNKIKNVSSLSYNFDFSPGDDYGSYRKPSQADLTALDLTATDGIVLDETNGNEGGSINITVSMNAVGLQTQEGNKLSNAQDALDIIESFTTDFVSRLSLTSKPYDIIIKNQTDNSSVSKTISYTKYPDTAPYRDSYTVNISYDVRNPEDYTRVSVQGRIQGLNTNATINSPLSDNRATNADAGWTKVSTQLYSRASGALSGVNMMPASKQYSYEDQGVISYNYTYDTRPLALVSGSLSESLNMSDTYQIKRLNHIPIVGGTSMQNLGTYNLPSRTVSYTARFLRGYSIPSSVEQMMENAIKQFDPKKMDTSTKSAIDSIVDRDETSRDFISNTITMTKQWRYFMKENP